MPMYGIALNPSLSGAAMAVSSIAVLMNSLLLRTSQAGKARPFSKLQPGNASVEPVILKGSPQA